jgi:hypothetical protein
MEGPPMSDTIRPLPQPPALTADTTTVQRGLAILAFVIEHHCTATVTDLDLESADHAGIVASAAPGMLVAVYDRISTARTAIRKALQYRATLCPQQSMIDASTASQGRLGGNPSSPVPLQPLPRHNPPAGMALDPDQYARVDRVQF